jgi:hypothetical protein
MIMNNIVDHQLNVEDVTEEHMNEDANDADEESNNIKNDNEALDDCGKVDLALVFQNTDDNPTKYVYIRDSTGRVVLVDCHLKLPQAK